MQQIQSQSRARKLRINIEVVIETGEEMYDLCERITNPEGVFHIDIQIPSGYLYDPLKI